MCDVLWLLYPRITGTIGLWGQRGGGERGDGARGAVYCGCQQFLAESLIDCDFFQTPCQKIIGSREALLMITVIYLSLDCQR